MAVFATIVEKNFAVAGAVDSAIDRAVAAVSVIAALLFEVG